MKHNYQPLVACVLGAMVITGCTDDNYDLSNIDSTTEIKFNDLTLPVNIKPIVLQNVLDIDTLDPNSSIIIDRTDPANPKYAFRKNEDFTTEAVDIDKITAAAPDIEGTRQTVKGTEIDFPLPDVSINVKALEYLVKEDHTSFKYDIADVDPSIKTVEKVILQYDSKQKTVLSISVHTTNIANVADKAYLDNVKFQLPKNMNIEVPDGCTFDSEGILTLPRLVADASNNFTPGIDIVVAGMSFTPAKKILNGTFDISENIGINSAKITILPKSNLHTSDIPSSLDFFADYKIGAMTVDKFSGEIYYEVSVDDIPLIALTDMPDFLNQEGTDMTLYNPSLTMTINNPIGDYNIGVKAGITIDALREENIPQSAPIVLEEFEIGHSGVGPYTVNLDANAQSVKIDGYKYTYPFPGLKGILAGNGIPKYLDIALKSNLNPKPVAFGNAQNFPLGRSLDQVKGTYVFSTPFALADGSTIVYTYTDQGWNDKDIDKLKVEMLKLTGDASSDIPMDIKMYVTVLGKNDAGESVELAKKETSTIIPAMANGAPFELLLEPADANVPFEHLNGITVTAIVSQKGNEGTALSPNQEIKLDNIRVTVSGTYTTDF